MAVRPCLVRPAVSAGQAVLTAEVLGRIQAELPAVGELGEREQVLVAANCSRTKSKTGLGVMRAPFRRILVRTSGRQMSTSHREKACK
jgi:hypothetical protein